MLTVEDLSFSYTGLAPYVLDRIDLQINDGEYVSILGENGSGKSTLVRLMLKFIKPVRGSIISNARITGYVPQKKDFSNAHFPITVFEMLNSYRRILKIKNKSAITENLELVGMASCKDALMSTLSSGQSQKIFIARALIGKPDLLILDEPSTGVDINSQKEIYSFLKNINKNNRITIISVEHNLDAAISNSTLIYHLSGGQGHLCTPEKYVEEYINTARKE